VDQPASGLFIWAGESGAPKESYSPAYRHIVFILQAPANIISEDFVQERAGRRVLIGRTSLTGSSDGQICHRNFSGQNRSLNSGFLAEKFIRAEVN